MAAMSSEDFDAMLAEMGDCGLFQFGQYMLIGLAFLYSAASPIVYVFTAALVLHRCLVPECGDENESSPFNPPWLGSAVPLDPESGEPEQCLRFAPLNASTCSFDQSQQIRCTDWVNKGPENTIQTSFDLMCEDNEWKMALIGSINSLGVLFSVPIVGYIADRYGRKLSLIATLVGSAVLALIKSAAPSYVFFAVFEFLEALFSGGIYGIAFVMALEYVSPKRRVVLGDMVAAWSYSLGNITVGLLAWGLRDWRHILWAINAPALLFVCYIWLVPESIRWLLSRGRLGDAKRVFTRALVNNKTILSAANADKLQHWENIKRSDAGIDLEQDVGEESLWPSLKLVTTSKILVFRLLICFFCWVVVTLVYYGLSLNSVNLAGTDDQYLNFILVSLADMPSNLLTWLGMTKLGRQKTLCLTLIFSGAACFANPFVPEDVRAARLPLYLIGKVAISGAFGVVYMFTAEIFPTKLRTSLLGLCSMVGRLGSMLAPLTPLLTNYSKFLPLALFGVLALVAGGLAFLLPETKGRPLPVTVEEAENLGRNNTEE